MVVELTLRAALSPFSGHSAMFSLVPLSILVTMGMLWIIRATSNQQAIRGVKRKLQAHMYELRLYTDEPVLIWKAQWNLFAANARYIGLMLVPVTVMAVPMLLVFCELECFYGYRPLQAGEQTVLTVQMKEGWQNSIPSLRVPDGIAVESPAVQVLAERQVSWRIRALRPLTGELQFIFPSQTIQKSVQAGVGPQYLSVRRVRSLLDLIWYPAEQRLPDGPLEWIELRYPKATIHAFWLDFHWLVWFFALSMASALTLKRQFGISF